MCWRQHPLKTGREKKRPWYPPGCPYAFHSHNQQGWRNCIWRCLWQSYPCKGSIKSVPCRGASCGNIQFSAGFVQRQEGPSFLAANGTPDLIFAKLFLKLNWHVELVSTVLTCWLQGSLRDQLPIFIARPECNLRHEICRCRITGAVGACEFASDARLEGIKVHVQLAIFCKKWEFGATEFRMNFFFGVCNLASFRVFFEANLTWWATKAGTGSDGLAGDQVKNGG